MGNGKTIPHQMPVPSDVEVPVSQAPEVAPELVDEDAEMLDRSPAVEKPKEVAGKSKPVHVIAIAPGIWKKCRKVEGDKFTLEDIKQFSKVWMKKI
jgi:hypothetical protein